MSEPTNDDLDDLLDNQPVLVDFDELLSGSTATDEDLTQLVTEPLTLNLPELAGPAGALEEFQESVPGVSAVTSKGSSLSSGPRRKAKFRDYAKLDLRKSRVKWADHIWAQANSQGLGANPIDKLSEPKIMQLVAALQQAEGKILQGFEASLILAPPEAQFKGKPLDDVDRLCLHLNAMEIDHVAILKLRPDTSTLRRGLLRRGLREGSDYEFLEPNQLLAYERSVLDRLLSKSTKRLRIVRKTSKALANV